MVEQIALIGRPGELRIVRTVCIIWNDLLDNALRGVIPDNPLFRLTIEGKDAAEIGCIVLLIITIIRVLERKSPYHADCLIIGDEPAGGRKAECNRADDTEQAHDEFEERDTPYRECRLFHVILSLLFCVCCLKQYKKVTAKTPVGIIRKVLNVVMILYIIF